VTETWTPITGPPGPPGPPGPGTTTINVTNEVPPDPTALGYDSVVVVDPNSMPVGYPRGVLAVIANPFTGTALNVTVSGTALTTLYTLGTVVIPKTNRYIAVEAVSRAVRVATGAVPSNYYARLRMDGATIQDTWFIQGMTNYGSIITKALLVNPAVGEHTFDCLMAGESGKTYLVWLDGGYLTVRDIGGY
jgi:hypothetical protein